MNTPATQDWTHALPVMQQSVLLSAIRGPDGIPKYSNVKLLLRWFRRCILISAIDSIVLDNPCARNGGSFTGPSLEFDTPEWEEPMNGIVSHYLTELDGSRTTSSSTSLHACDLGYKHPVPRIAQWWLTVYQRLVGDMHLQPESESHLNERLGDSESGWLKHADQATAN